MPADSTRHRQSLPTEVGRALLADATPVARLSTSPDSPDVADGTGHVEVYEVGDGYLVEDWGGAEGFRHWAVTQAGVESLFSEYSPASWDEFSHEFVSPPVWVQRIERARADDE